MFKGLKAALDRYDEACQRYAIRSGLKPVVREKVEKEYCAARINLCNEINKAIAAPHPSHGRKYQRKGIEL